MEYGKQMEILYAHNSIRSKFSHDNGTSPSPAKDYKLEWNCDLERIAQFEANICNATIVPVSHKIVQKIFTKIHNNGTNKDIFKEAIDNWFNHNESKNIASLIQIGCGINHCPTNEGSLETLFVCLYFSRPKEITQFNKACQFDSDCSAYENSICNHNTNLCETSNSRGQNSLARTASRKNPSLVLTSYKDFGVFRSMRGLRLYLLANAEATELGCGMNICTQGANKKLFIICKYGTRSESNSSSESLFKFGPPCKDDTDCTLYEQSTCLNHHGLCVRHIE
ncbi:unnamed protein product [Dracunculus medinensis]|uniref:SCP domain-containing protein n=1 Tax=Dracunculus medinensis TaxID=318479 RepID=A0A158Q5E0_DRAME|nr:unnamed protein product [Dracunculus medinensis]